MKKLILFGIFALLSLATIAQAPQGINYQAVVRNTNNQILSSATVGVSISLRQTTAAGTIVYQEHFTTTTTTNGLINLVIGTGTVDQGTFNNISWGQGPYFVEIGIDQTGGTNYNSIGTQQLMSVPYALYAETAGNPGPQGPQGPIGLTGATGPQGPAGTNGQNGVGISSTIDNGNGTFTFNYTDGSSFTTSTLTGPQGPIGLTGATGQQGPAGNNGQNGVGISSTIDNGNGTFTLNYSDGSSFTTSNLTGPQGAIGMTGATGPQGPAGTNGQNGVGISSTINNGNGTYTFNYTDGSSFTTSNLTGPQGPVGMTGATGPQGPAGDPATDNQTLAISNDSLFISNGNGISLSSLSSNSTGGNLQIISSGTGSFQVPANVNFLIVEMWGAGGGGGAGGVSSCYACGFATSGAGGGSGGYKKTILAVSSGQIINYSVGIGGGSGIAGQASTFGGLTIAGGNPGADGQGNLGSTTSSCTGTIKPAGGAGGPGGNNGANGLCNNPDGASGAKGGNGPLQLSDGGNGGPGQSPGVNGNNGFDGGPTAGGGGGSATYRNSSTGTGSISGQGGKGGNGLIIVYY